MRGVVVGAVVMCAFAAGCGSSSRNSGAAASSTEPPTTTPRPVVVRVDDAPNNELRISFPGRRVTGDPQILSLPSGDIRFEIHGMTGGHSLALDGVPSFAPAVFDSPGVQTRTVRLARGQYLLHCMLPSHGAAGEQAVLNVSDDSPGTAP